MKHSKRIFLVPEELYQHFFSSPSPLQDGTVLGHIKAKMHNLSSPSQMSQEERAIKFDQEFKRYSKLQKEQEEKPLNVRLQNLKEIAESLPQQQTGNKILKIPVKKSNRYKIREKKSKPIKVESEIGEDEIVNDGEENEIFEDALSQKHQSTSSSFEDRKKRAYEFVNENLNSLGVNKYGQVIQSSSTGSIPLKTSNVAAIIDHLVNNEGNRRKPLPVGYDKIVERLNSHPDLLKILGLKQQRPQSGSGAMMLFKKAYKDGNKKSPFKFKPSLWV